MCLCSWDEGGPLCGRWNAVRLAFFSERAAFWKPLPKERRGGWDHGCWCPLFFFSLFCVYHSVHLSGTLLTVSRSLNLSLDLSFLDIPVSLLCHSQPVAIPPLATHSPRRLTPHPPLNLQVWQSQLSCRWSGLFEMECTGFGPPMIRADGLRSYGWGLPLRYLIVDLEATAPLHDREALLLFLVESCWGDKRD